MTGTALADGRSAVWMRYGLPQAVALRRTTSAKTVHQPVHCPVHRGIARDWTGVQPHFARLALPPTPPDLQGDSPHSPGLCGCPFGRPFAPASHRPNVVVTLGCGSRPGE